MMTMVLLLMGSPAVSQEMPKKPSQLYPNPDQAMMMKKPVVCGQRDGLVNFVQKEHGEKPVMGWLDAQTGEPVMFYFNAETKTSSVIERLPSRGGANGMPVFACIISGGKGAFFSQELLESLKGPKI